MDTLLQSGLLYFPVQLQIAYHSPDVWHYWKCTPLPHLINSPPYHIKKCILILLQFLKLEYNQDLIFSSVSTAECYSASLISSVHTILALGSTSSAEPAVGMELGRPKPTALRGSGAFQELGVKCEDKEPGKASQSFRS